MKYDFEEFGLVNSVEEFGGFEIVVEYMDCDNWNIHNARYSLYSFKNALNYALNCTKYDDVHRVHIMNEQTGEVHYIWENGMKYYQKP